MVGESTVVANKTPMDNLVDISLSLRPRPRPTDVKNPTRRIPGVWAARNLEMTTSRTLHRTIKEDTVVAVIKARMDETKRSPATAREDTEVLEEVVIGKRKRKKVAGAMEAGAMDVTTMTPMVSSA